MSLRDAVFIVWCLLAVACATVTYIGSRGLGMAGFGGMIAASGTSETWRLVRRWKR